jgi:hypothetical protein
MNSWLKLLRLPHLAAQAGIDRDVNRGYSTELFVAYEAASLYNII